MQFLKSPGGIIPNSLLSLPELPPSSDTPMMAVRLLVCFLSPFKSTDNPVPPPMATILGPLSLARRSYKVSPIVPIVTSSANNGDSVLNNPFNANNIINIPITNINIPSEYHGKKSGN